MFRFTKRKNRNVVRWFIAASMPASFSRSSLPLSLFLSPETRISRRNSHRVDRRIIDLRPSREMSPGESSPADVHPRASVPNLLRIYRRSKLHFDRARETNFRLSSAASRKLVIALCTSTMSFSNSSRRTSHLHFWKATKSRRRFPCEIQKVWNRKLFCRNKCNINSCKRFAKKVKTKFQENWRKITATSFEIFFFSSKKISIPFLRSFDFLILFNANLDEKTINLQHRPDINIILM